MTSFGEFLALTGLHNFIDSLKILRKKSHVIERRVSLEVSANM